MFSTTTVSTAAFSGDILSITGGLPLLPPSRALAFASPLTNSSTTGLGVCVTSLGRSVDMVPGLAVGFWSFLRLTREE